MRIISRKGLREFWEVNPDAEQTLEDWYRIANLTSGRIWLRRGSISPMPIR
jgi:mRNA-degrading endonuclease HigB of HigAB toxin-antitoxin module